MQPFCSYQRIGPTVIFGSTEGPDDGFEGELTRLQELEPPRKYQEDHQLFLDQWKALIELTTVPIRDRSYAAEPDQRKQALDLAKSKSKAHFYDKGLAYWMELSAYVCRAF